MNILDILSISRGINFRDSAGQFFSRGFSFAKMAKKRENAKVSPPKVISKVDLNSHEKDNILIIY